MLYWTKVLSAEEMEGTFIRKVKAGNTNVCVVGFEGEIHAVSAKCPHAGAELADGRCEQGKIICPVHRFQYDLETGKGAPGQGDYIDVFPVEIRKDGVYVKVKKKWSLF